MKIYNSIENNGRGDYISIIKYFQIHWFCCLASILGRDGIISDGLNYLLSECFVNNINKIT